MIRNAPLKNYYDEVLKLVPQGSASGQIATIDDGGKDCPLKSLVVDIEPIQSGSGNPSPSNVRAISARSEVAVTRTGKNLLPPQTLSGTRNGVTIVSNNGVYTLSGTSTAFTQFFSPDTFTLQAGSYVLNSNGGMPTNTVAAQLRSVDGLTTYASSFNSGAAFTLTEATEVRFRIVVWSGNTIDVTLKPQLEVGNTASEFEPYVWQTITISLGQSIYGGILDVKNGILEITHELLTVDGTADWNEYGGTGFRLYNVLPTVCTFAHGVCNEFKVLSSFGDETGIILGNNNRHLYVSSVVGSVSGVSDLATWKTFLNSSPMVFTAPTASPTTVSLSPTEIRTLYGINNLWSDSGNVETEYKANATLLYEKIRNAIIAQGGQI